MVGQANFSQKQLHGKSCNMIKEMLLENNINWEDYPIYCQRGTAVIYEDGVWQIDSNMPILKDNREYLDKRVYVGEN
jgi:hypothetical protein